MNKQVLYQVSGQSEYPNLSLLTYRGSTYGQGFVNGLAVGSQGQILVAGRSFPEGMIPGVDDQGQYNLTS